MTPSQESALFMHELGRAISEWAYLELDLAVLVAAAVSQADRHSLQVGFFAIENFRSKLAYCDNVLTERFHATPGFERWELLRAKIEALSRKRNQLAHQTVMVYPGGSEGRRTAILNWKANFYASPKLAPKGTRGKGPPSGALCLGDLAQLSLEFKAAMYAIRNVRALVLGEPPAYRLDYETAPPAPTVAKLFKEFNARVFSSEA